MTRKSLENLVSTLETDAQRHSKWFLDHDIKQNSNKCHPLIFREEDTDASVHVGATTITESVEGKVLGVTLGRNLNFKNHTNKTRKKAGQMLIQLHAFQTIWMLTSRG